VTVESFVHRAVGNDLHSVAEILKY